MQILYSVSQQQMDYKKTRKEQPKKNIHAAAGPVGCFTQKKQNIFWAEGIK